MCPSTTSSPQPQFTHFCPGSSTRDLLMSVGKWSSWLWALESDVGAVPASSPGHTQRGSQRTVDGKGVQTHLNGPQSLSGSAHQAEAPPQLAHHHVHSPVATKATLKAVPCPALTMDWDTCSPMLTLLATQCGNALLRQDTEIGVIQ